MERILLKISGASLKGDDSNIINISKIQEIAKQIKELTTKYSIGIVIGGGNIWRGNFNKELNINKCSADDMGMLATLINSLALENVLRNLNVNVKSFCSFENSLCRKFNHYEVDNFLNNKGSVAIFAGGTGNSHFSTDTAAALRASQINSKKILMGKNGVDGVYDDDPKINPNAQFYDTLDYDEIIIKNLKVMDTTSLALCRENGIEIIVFNIDSNDSIRKILNGERIRHTRIYKKGK